MRLKFLNNPSNFDIFVQVSACKPFMTSHGSPRSLFKLLRRHAKIGQCLKHPNVVPLYGLGYDTSHGSAQELLFVLPFFSYGNIMDYLRSHPDLTDRDKLRLVRTYRSSFPPSPGLIADPEHRLSTC
jgi:serine/threonine protein kinase